jgi:hypothetical protein
MSNRNTNDVSHGGGGGGSSSGTGNRGLGGGDYRSGGDQGQGHPDEIHNMYANAAARFSSMGGGGGVGSIGGGGGDIGSPLHGPQSQGQRTAAEMMGMNMNNLSSMMMGGGGMNVNNMTSGMSTAAAGGIPDMDMLALYRAKEKMAMMNARRAAFLQGQVGSGGDDQQLQQAYQHQYQQQQQQHQQHHQQYQHQHQGLFGNMPSGGYDGNRLASYLQEGGGAAPHGSTMGSNDINIAAALKKRRIMDDDAIIARRTNNSSTTASTTNTKSGKRRKKAKKDADMPRRALSAYNIFFSEQRRKILDEIDSKSKEETKKTDKEDDSSEAKKEGTDDKDDATASAKKKSSDKDEEKDEEGDKSKQEGKGEEKKKPALGEEAKEENDDEEEEEGGKKKKSKSKEDNEEEDSEATLATRTFFPTRTKRAHRKVHGKIGLVQLAREVSKRWKALDSVSRSHFEGLAEEDRKRHKVVMAEYQQRKTAENMLNMGGKKDEADSRTDEKHYEGDEGAPDALTQDIRETITHQHQQRLLAEMMIARQSANADPMSRLGGGGGAGAGDFASSMGMSTPFGQQGGGGGGMGGMQNVQDMQAVQRAIMIQRHRWMEMGGGGGNNMGGGNGTGMGGGNMGGSNGGMGGNMG